MERLPYGKYTKEFRQEAVKLVIQEEENKRCQVLTIDSTLLASLANSLFAALARRE